MKEMVGRGGNNSKHISFKQDAAWRGRFVLSLLSPIVLCLIISSSYVPGQWIYPPPSHSYARVTCQDCWYTTQFKLGEQSKVLNPELGLQNGGHRYFA